MQTQSYSLKAKLLLLCGFLSAIAIAVGVTSDVTLIKVGTNFGSVVDKDIPKMRSSYEMMLDYRRIRISLRTLGIKGLSPAQATETVKDTLAAIEAYETEAKEYESYGFIDGQKEHYDKVNAAWQDFRAVGVKALGLWKAGTPEDLEKLSQVFLVECPAKAAVFNAAMENLSKFHETTTQNSVTAAHDVASTGVQLIIIV
ncbi:MAG: hypothetical protein EOP06_07830, partial [Proteobacteria bacterium]